MLVLLPDHLFHYLRSSLINSCFHSLKVYFISVYIITCRRRNKVRKIIQPSLRLFAYFSICKYGFRWLNEIDVFKQIDGVERMHLHFLIVNDVTYFLVDFPLIQKVKPRQTDMCLFDMLLIEVK